MRKLIFLATVVAQLGVMFYTFGFVLILAAIWLGILGAFAIAMRSQDPGVRRIWRPLAVLLTIGGVIFLGFYFRETVRDDLIFATLTAITTITLATQLQLFQTYKSGEETPRRGTAFARPSAKADAATTAALVRAQKEEQRLLAEIAEKNQLIRDLKARVARLEERVTRQGILLADIDPFADEPAQSPKGN